MDKLVINQFAVANYKNKRIYLSGGRFSYGEVNHVHYLDMRSKLWVQAPPLNQARHCHVSICLGRCVYILAGGGNDELRNGSIERLCVG